uniref:Uncharacterized protein n=1 Tax=Anguilla anguilla TaxID=7936 RepID=A0A0E9RYK3_ANGAN
MYNLRHILNYNICYLNPDWRKGGTAIQTIYCTVLT